MYAEDLNLSIIIETVWPPLIKINVNLILSYESKEISAL